VNLIVITFNVLGEENIVKKFILNVLKEVKM